MTWTLETPPLWAPNAVKTEKGWEDPDTGEVLVAIGDLVNKGGAAAIASVAFGSESYEQGDPLSVIVRFTEAVDVTGGATLEVSSTGAGGNITLHAAAQSDTNVVVFDKQVDESTAETVPLETADLSIAAQTILGTLVDTVGGDAASLAISGTQASEAGTRSVA